MDLVRDVIPLQVNQIGAHYLRRVNHTEGVVLTYVQPMYGHKHRKRHPKPVFCPEIVRLHRRGQNESRLDVWGSLMSLPSPEALTRPD